METIRQHWVSCLPFFFVHVAAWVGAFVFPPTAGLLLLCLATYTLRMFAITGGYHRYFSHRSYKTNRLFQFALAWIGSSSIQKGVLWWAANHRWHHRFSDQPEDIHSPKQSGFWESHVLWILRPDYAETRWDQIQDLAKYPELRWLNRWHLVPVFVLAAICFGIGGFPSLVWGFFVSTVFCWHCTFFINSLAHVHGTRRYQTSDTSRNNWWLAILTLGEGWHNNHHCYMSSTRQGFFWWEIDLTFYILKALSWVGITRELRSPPLALLENKRITNSRKRPAPGAREIIRTGVEA